MSAAALLAELRTIGVKLEAHGGLLKYRGPADKLTPELTGRLKFHKVELLAALEVETSRAWLLHYAGRDPVQVYFSPPATKAEVLAIYHAAIAAEPIQIAANDGDPPQAFLEQTDAQILEGAAELDALIGQLCNMVGFEDGARGRMLAARKRMAPAQLPGEINYFRQQVSKAQTNRYWDGENA